jgi:hypothetical protein
MSTVSKDLNAAAEQFARNMSKYPVEEQIAINSISANALNGCSWEFVRRDVDIMKNMDAFKNSKNVSLYEVTYSHDRGIRGYLVCMDFSYMLNIFMKEAPGLFEAKELERIRELHTKALQKLGKLLAGKVFRGRIGIYCTNDGTTITKDGVTYPAFPVSLLELLQVCKQCGYGVVVDNISRNPDEVWKRAPAFLKASTVAPSSNALFIDIAPLV